MDDRDREHLGNLLAHAEAAIGYTKVHGRDWWKNRETVDAVLMRISQVGEAASRTSPQALAEVPSIAWRDVKGIRAKTVHDYEMIDLVVIRGIVDRQLPPLIAAVLRVLGRTKTAVDDGS
jgi:uncharacterized protein with HEPN domain